VILSVEGTWVRIPFWDWRVFCDIPWGGHQVSRAERQGEVIRINGGLSGKGVTEGPRFEERAL